MEKCERQPDPADRRLFTVSAEEYDTLVEMLNAPPQDMPRLRALLSPTTKALLDDLADLTVQHHGVMAELLAERRRADKASMLPSASLGRALHQRRQAHVTERRDNEHCDTEDRRLDTGHQDGLSAWMAS